MKRADYGVIGLLLLAVLWLIREMGKDAQKRADSGVDLAIRVTESVSSALQTAVSETVKSVAAPSAPIPASFHDEPEFDLGPALDVPDPAEMWLDLDPDPSRVAWVPPAADHSPMLP